MDASCGLKRMDPKNTAAGSVAAQAETATERSAGQPHQDRQPADADGLNGAVNRLLSAKGIAPVTETTASAGPESEAESETDLSQSKDESGSLAAAPDADAEDQQEQADEAAEEEAEGTEEGESDDAEEAPHKGFQKRINKLTARAKAAEEQVEQLRREVEELKSAKTETPSTSANDPAADPEMEAIGSRLKQVRSEMGLAEDLRAQLAVDADRVAEILKNAAVKLPNYDPQTMRDWLNDYLSEQRSKSARMEGEMDARRKVIEGQSKAKREEVLKLTAKAMPWTSDNADPRYQHYKRIMSTPAAKAIPDAAFFVAAGIEKMVAMEARAKAETVKPKVKSAPTVRPSAKGSGAPAATKAKDPLQAARENLRTGGMKSVLDYAKAAVEARP